MSLRKQYQTNIAAEIDGFELKLEEAPNDDGTIPTFILSRMGSSNRAYARALEVATRPYRRQIELNTMPNEKADELFKDVFITNVLKGWKNILLSDVTGKDSDKGFAEFNKQNALSMFNQPGMRDLYERLQEEAKTASNFRAVSTEEEAKN